MKKGYKLLPQQKVARACDAFEVQDTVTGQLYGFSQYGFTTKSKTPLYELDRMNPKTGEVTPIVTCHNNGVATMVDTGKKVAANYLNMKRIMYKDSEKLRSIVLKAERSVR